MGKRGVIDTNVPLVANGAANGVAPKCRLATIDFLEDFMQSGDLVVDLDGAIEEEYRRQLGVGNPGVGNRFLQKFFSEAAHRVVRVSASIDKHGHCKHLKFEGNLRKFDRSDRKFVAAALEAKCSVYNATDSDWVDHCDDLAKHGVSLEFICGSDKRSWFT